MKTKKLLSILLALMMMLSVVPMYASAAETLKAANVETYPTLSYKNADGKMYYGQSLEEALVINDDEVVKDAAGNQVAGHFEFRKPEYMPIPGTDYKLDIKFIPDDAEAYSSFTKLKSSLIYSVEAVALVPVDTNDTTPVATEVEAGALLSTSILSGAKYTNPYNANEPNIASREWEWCAPTTVVNESGYYEAMLVPVGYDKITAQVYVKIASNIPETTISEMPVIEPLAYDASMTLKDVVIKGGVAVLKNEGTVVDGTFSIAESAKDYPLSVGNYNVPVTFTPTDPEAALPYTFDVPITVTKAPIRFVDENGNDVVPEITGPYGTDFNYIPQLLMPYVKGAEYTLISLGDLENTKCTTSGTYTVTASAPSEGKYYEKTELSFKLVVEPKALAPKAYSSPEGYYVEDTSGTYRPEGTFDVYIDGKLYKTGVAYLERVAYVPKTSGTHEIKFVYKPIENDNFAIENEIKNTFAINLVHKLTLGDNVLGKPGDYRYSTEIELSANSTAENFEGWKITDAKGNEVDLGVDLTATKITITMPDYDIHVEALEKNATSGGSGGIFDMDFGDLTEGDSEWAIINIIRNIIAMFKSFLQQLIETFQSIGD